nr:MAG TPA: hypothetical protein [Caudoviricetes sp.]DAW60374.1 MAG TPA: hypothetical protein [Caudoviricetes sp.]
MFAQNVKIHKSVVFYCTLYFVYNIFVVYLQCRKTNTTSHDRLPIKTKSRKINIWCSKSYKI